MSKSIAETAHMNPFKEGDMLYLTEDYVDAPSGTRCYVNRIIGRNIVSAHVEGLEGVRWVPTKSLRHERRKKD